MNHPVNSDESSDNPHFEISPASPDGTAKPRSGERPRNLSGVCARAFRAYWSTISRITARLRTPAAHLSELAMTNLQIAGGAEALARWNQIPGYFNPVKAQSLQQVVRQLSDGARLAELGSFQGRSSIAIASVMPAESRLWCVDHFQGSVEHQRMNLGDLFESFQKNLEAFGVRPRIEVLRMSTLQAANQFQASSLDFLLVDAAHDYESVKADLEHWYPKLKPGGFLVCDDYHAEWPGVMQAVDDMNQPGQVVAGPLWVHRRPLSKLTAPL